jgi:DNA-binding transcriptional LysR family regulator
MDRLQLRPRQIDIFRAVMRTGGASAAARLLGLSQPLVSQQLGSLETAIGVSLFERNRGRLVPTREGVAFHNEVERHYLSMEQLARKAQSLRAGNEGKLIVGCLPGLGFTLIPHAVKRFRDAYPNVFVSLQTVSSGLIKDRVASGEWDIGFAASEIDTTGVVHSVFSRVPAVVVIPKAHPLAAAQGPVTLSELREHPLVVLNPEDVTRHQLQSAMAAENVTLNVVAETPYGAGVWALVAAGVGIGITNPLSTPEENPDGIIQRPLNVKVEFSSLVLFSPQGSPSVWAKELLRFARLCLAERLNGQRARVGLQAAGR